MIHSLKANKTTAYLLLVLIAILLSYFFKNFIFTNEIITDHFIQQLSIDRIEKMLEFQAEWQWISYAILPIIYLLKFTFITLWLLCGVILFGYKTSFKKLFQVVLLAEFVWIVPSLITLVWFGFFNTNYTFLEVQYFQPLSLMNFFDGESVEQWLIFPLKALNLFEIAYMLVLAIGIRKIIEKDYNTSLSFVVPVYGLGLVTWLVFVTFLSINLAA